MSVEKLIKSLRAYPKHTAIRFSFDGKSESWLVESFHKLADTYEYLQERLHKCDGMAKEINILTAENRRQAAEVAELRDVLKSVYETRPGPGFLYQSSDHHLCVKIAKAVLDKHKESGV